MSIEQLGSIGEFISSLAVVVSVLYLAYQVRQTRTHLVRTERNTTMEQASSLRAMMMDPDFAALLVKSQTQPDSMSAAERLQIDAFLGNVFWNGFNMWDRVRTGIFEDDWSRSVAPSLHSIIVLPHGRRWWQENKSTFPQEYSDAVDALVGSE